MYSQKKRENILKNDFRCPMSVMRGLQYTVGSPFLSEVSSVPYRTVYRSKKYRSKKFRAIF
jgi:hypothetical protein